MKGFQIYQSQGWVLIILQIYKKSGLSLETIFNLRKVRIE